MSIEITIIDIRQFYNSLIFLMGIPYLERQS